MHGNRKPECPSATSPASVTRLKRAIRFALPQWQAVAVLSIITLVLAAINAAEPLLLKYVFDGLSEQRQFRPLLVGLAWLAGLGVLRELAAAGTNWLSWKTRISIHNTVLEAMIARLHRAPLSFHHMQGAGATMTKLDRSIQGFLNALTQLLFNVFPAIVYLLLAVAVMWRMNPALTLLVLCFAPIPAIIATRVAPEQARREKTLFDRYVRIYSRFNEVLSSILTVRSFAMEDREKQRYLDDVEAANKVVIRGVGTDTVSAGLTNLVLLAARLAAMALGGVLFVSGEITIGTLLAFLGYLGGLFGPVQSLSGIYQTVQRVSVSLEEMFSILDLEEQLADRPNARRLECIRGDVEFEDVHFAYDDVSEPVLRGINLRVAAGETIAIVGSSGGGKTTIASLLMRFYDPVRGTVRVDGTDLRNVDQTVLRRNIAIVLQEPILFNDTVRNNIAYGRPDASGGEIIAAAKGANAHDFVMQLPAGYDTVLGERGGRLSVGERQRITIARALLKNAPLIILDEASSSLDADSEALVQEALERLAHGRTTFVIAHRLATVASAHRIALLQEGRIAECGTHAQLMRAGGRYSLLVRRQMSGLMGTNGKRDTADVAA